VVLGGVEVGELAGRGSSNARVPKVGERTLAWRACEFAADAAKGGPVDSRTWHRLRPRSLRGGAVLFQATLVTSTAVCRTRLRGAATFASGSVAT
jgi:hypothetical protein